MFLTFINKPSQVKVQKQGQNVKIQHGFICYHFCQLIRPTVCLGATYHSSDAGLIQAHRQLVDAQQLLFSILKAETFGDRKPFIWEKNKGKGEWHTRQLLLAQSLLSALFPHWGVGSGVRLVSSCHIWEPGAGPKFQSSHQLILISLKSNIQISWIDLGLWVVCDRELFLGSPLTKFNGPG